VDNVMAMMVEVEYKVAGDRRKWTTADISTPIFDPPVDFDIADQQTVTVEFGCYLSEPIPDGVTIRVTAGVRIAGRVKGNNKEWYYSSQ
jgi:hypothetical protein